MILQAGRLPHTLELITSDIKCAVMQFCTEQGAQDHIALLQSAQTC